MNVPEHDAAPGSDAEGYDPLAGKAPTYRTSVPAGADITQLLRNAYRGLGLVTITTATAVLHTLTAAALAVLVVIA